MVQDKFDISLAYNPNVAPDEDRLVRSATFQVFAVDDLSFTTPLAVFEPASGAAIAPLTSNADGVLPQFAVAGNPPEVNIKSGTFITRVQSRFGVLTEAGFDAAAVAAAVSSVEAAEAARDAALAAQAAVEAIPITADGMMAAIAGSVFGVVPIEQFVNAGETLVTDGSGSGNNTTIWQRAVDQCNAWFIADGKPRKIQVKPGSVMRFVRQGFEPLSGAPYGLRWKSGVGIASNGDPTSVTFVAPTNATMFHAAKSFGSIEHVYVDAHTVDGSQQSNATYTTMMKAWFIQDLNHARFRDILIKETWATGFGCDFLRDTVVTGVARGCGRGLIELAVDPLTTSGGSGFGIGTGLFEVEDYVLDVSAFDCGFHGVFTETQELYKVAGDITWHFSKGSRIRAYVEGNFVGFRDCGSDGLTADIIAVNNTYAGVLHDRTVLAPSAGRNGRLRGELSGNGTGLLIGLATAGAYAFDVQAHHNVGDGIATKSGGGFAPHTAIRGASYDNGGRGIEIGLPSTDLLVDVRTWDNTEEGLALLGTSLAATGIQISGDYRGDGAVVEQAITGSYRIDARGLSATAPWGLAVTPSGSTSLVAAWEEPLIADDITDYTVQYRLVGDSVWTTFAHAASTATTQTLTALNAGDQYEVRVAAVSPAGTSAWAAAFGWTGALLMGDTFNRADATGGLGTMDSGCSPVAYAGGVSWSISNNRAFSTATGTASIAAFNTGVVARTIEATLTNYLAGSTVGVLLRGTTSSSNVGVVRSSGGFWQIVKVVSGTTTALLVSTIPVSSGDTVKVVCLAGGVYRMFVNGQFVGSVTDSHLATDTNAALRAVTPNSFDDLHVYA